MRNLIEAWVEWVYAERLQYHEAVRVEASTAGDSERARQAERDAERVLLAIRRREGEWFAGIALQHARRMPPALAAMVFGPALGA